MRPLGFIEGIAGFPPVTLLLFVAYGYAGYAWYEGRMRDWVAWVTLGLAVGTLKALVRWSRYRRWQAAWDRMSDMGDAPPPPKGSGWRALLRFGVVAVLVGVPPLVLYVVKNRYHAEELEALWCAVAAGVVLVQAVRLARGYLHRHRVRSEEKAMAASVSWMLGRASSSPSWRSARRRVPDYAGRVLRGKVSKPRLKRGTRDAITEE